MSVTEASQKLHLLGETSGRTGSYTEEQQGVVVSNEVYTDIFSKCNNNIFL